MTIRRLLLLRHAKSDWPEGVPDFERPLAGRGRRDAAAAGDYLARQGLVPDLVVCSPARRTRQTWEFAAQSLGRAPEVRYDDRVYAADVAALMGVVHETTDGVRTLLVVGHNPGMEAVTHALAPEGDPEALNQLMTKFPTCTLAVVTLRSEWSAVVPGAGRLTTLAVLRGGR